MKTKEQVVDLQETKDIFPLEAQEIISGEKGRENIVVLDVCTQKEYETAHLEGAVHIDYFSKLFKSRLDLLDRNKTYLVYCRMGGIQKGLQYCRWNASLGGRGTSLCNGKRTEQVGPLSLFHRDHIDKEDEKISCSRIWCVVKCAEGDCNRE